MDAHFVCGSEGARLAELSDSDAYASITEVRGGMGEESPWIGMVAAGQEVRFELIF